MSQQDDIKSLKKRIKELEKENATLHKQPETFATLKDTVSVPDEIKPYFDEAQKTVKEYFSHLKFDPSHGTIEIHDERYVLVRASALSSDFLATIQQLYADRGEKEALTIGKEFLFDIAHVIGGNDAKKFHSDMHLTNPIAMLAAGPVHFAYTGWAFVDILPESNPTPNDDFYLIYNHPYSFEADCWISAKRKSNTPVCVMSSGYSSGWCEQSFGIPLTAVEVTCRAKGDKKCTFIMAPPHKIKQYLDEDKLKALHLHNKKTTYDIPTFFERKKMEEQMALYAQIIESTEDAVASVDLAGNFTSWNRGAWKLTGFTEKEVLGKHVSLVVPPERMEEETKMFEEILKGGSVQRFETIRMKKNGKRFPISLTAAPIKDSKGVIIGFSKIGHDISKRKKIEAALKDLNNSLEQLVQERTSDLQRAYDELETRVTFRNLELEKTNKANLEKIEILEKQLVSLNTKK